MRQNALCRRVEGTRGLGPSLRHSPITMAGMDQSMGSGTRQAVLAMLRWRQERTRRLHRKTRIDRAVELLAYHCESAIRALAAVATATGP